MAVRCPRPGVREHATAKRPKVGISPAPVEGVFLTPDQGIPLHDGLEHDELEYDELEYDELELVDKPRRVPYVAL